jgi:hypothetical protein
MGDDGREEESHQHDECGPLDAAAPIVVHGFLT